MSFDKWTMSYIHHQHLIQNNVTTLKYPLCIPKYPSSLLTNSWPSQIFLPSQQFHLFQNNIINTIIITWYAVFFGLTSFTGQSAFRFIKMFFCIYWDESIDFLYFYLLLWCVTLIDFQIRNQPCIPEISLWFLLISVCYYDRLDQSIFKC